MSNSDTKYYHFAWNDSDRAPASSPPDVTARERVAKILRETELQEVPDLVFRSQGDVLPPSTSSRDVSSSQQLRDATQLFSIDDADWSNDEEVNNDDIDVTRTGSSDVKPTATGADEQLLRVTSSHAAKQKKSSKSKPKGGLA